MWLFSCIFFSLNVFVQKHMRLKIQFMELEIPYFKIFFPVDCSIIWTSRMTLTTRLKWEQRCRNAPCVIGVKLFRNDWKKMNQNKKPGFMPTNICFFLSFSIICRNLNKTYWKLNFEWMRFVTKMSFLSENYLGHYSKKVHQQEGVFAVLIVLWASSMSAWLENEKLFCCQFSVTICCVSPEYWLQRGVLDLLDTSERKYF